MMALRVADLHLILPRQLQCCLNGFGPSAGKVNASTCEVISGKGQQFSRELFRNRCGELAVMDKFKVPRLLRHRRSDFRHSVPNEVDRRGSGEIQILLAVSVPKVDTLATNRGRESLAE